MKSVFLLVIWLSLPALLWAGSSTTYSGNVPSDTLSGIIVDTKGKALKSAKTATKNTKIEKKTADGTITGEELRSTGATHFFTALTGRFAGVQVVSGRVTIRGSTSFKSADNEPLFVLDGSIVSFDVLDVINIQDVKSVKVLKTAAKYGSRGANGAIEVSTK